MQAIVLITLVTSLICIGFGGRALIWASKDRAHRLFAILCLLMGGWFLLMAGFFHWGAPSISKTWMGAIAAFEFLVIGCFLKLWQMLLHSHSSRITRSLEKEIDARTQELLESNEALAQEIAERRNVENALRAKSRFEDLIATISTQFINMPQDSIGEGITQALQQVGAFLGMDRACIYLLSQDRDSISTIYEWRRDGLPQSAFHASEAFTDWHSRIRASSGIEVLSRSQLTNEEDLRFFDALGAKSLVMLPMTPAGALMFETLNEEHPWNEDSLIMLQMLAQILSSALDRKQFEQKLNFLAYHDPLTGLPNRLLMQDRLQHACYRAKRAHDSVAVMLVDLDRFKEINDVLGHDTGDQLLHEVAQRMLGCVRTCDTVARSGGDEFVLIFPDIKEEWDIETLAQRILDAFADPFMIDGHEIHSTPSIGISVFPRDGETAELLVKNSDIAMFRAKSQGRNNHQFFTPTMSDVVARRRALEISLRKAIEREEFLLHYQPQVELKTGRIVGIEALVRWQHPEKGMVPPMHFIPLAEETGLIVPIGEWVLEKACLQNKAWQEMGFDPMRVAINLSARQFHASQQQGLLETVTKVLERTQLSPDFLELEITETTAMQDLDATVAILERLHGIGVKLSIDDFGTGHSSLSYLKKFPIQALKIDRSFVKDLTEDADDAAIVRAIIAMARSLKLRVIAEGVETSEQMDFLRDHHCEEIQGYFFSKPVTPEELMGILKRQGQVRQEG